MFYSIKFLNFLNNAIFYMIFTPFCRAVACVVNSNFKSIFIKKHFCDKNKLIERNGSLKDVEEIKTTCANLGVTLNEHDIVLNQKRNRILDKIQTVGAGEEGNGNVND